MRCLLILCLTFLLPSLSFSTRAETVQVDGVEGRVLYGAGDHTPSVPVKVGQILTAGTFSAQVNGILYLSTFAGSELRLAESGTLHFYGGRGISPIETLSGSQSVFRLLDGKLRVTIHQRKIPQGYRIMLARASASVGPGQCVICMHADGAFVYVARGTTMLTSSGGSAASVSPGTEAAGAASPRGPGVRIAKSLALAGNGDVGVLDQEGTFRVRPLSAVSAGTQNCLLAGFNPDAAGGAPPASVDAGSVVSPTQ